MTRDATQEQRWDRERDYRKHEERPSDRKHDLPFNAATIAQLARASSTSFDEAVRLIQSFADTTASHEAVRVVEEMHRTTMAVLA